MATITRWAIALHTDSIDCANDEDIELCIYCRKPSDNCGCGYHAKIMQGDEDGS